MMTALVSSLPPKGFIMIIFEFIKSHKNTELCFMDIPLIRKGDPLFDKKKYGLSITSNFGSFFPAFGFYLGKTDKWFNLVGFVEQEDKYELEPEGERFTRSFEHQGVNYIFHSGYAWTVRKGTNQIVDAKSGAWILDESLVGKTPMGQIYKISFCSRTGVPKDLETSVRELVNLLGSMERRLEKLKKS